MANRASTAIRLGRFIELDDDGCWLWTASTNNHGYGKFTLGGTRRLAHRVAYETFVGPIPDGLTLDHLCRVRSCVNPAHLEAVTLKENVRRSPVHISKVRRAQTRLRKLSI